MATGVMTLAQMDEELVRFMQGPQPVLVTTMDPETGWPVNNLLSWVVAIDPSTVRLAADANGRVISQIRADERVLLTVMAHGACHCIEGIGRIVSEQLEGVSLNLRVAEVKVRAVRDVTFWGGRITVEPQYEVTYDKALKEQLDTGVFAGMRSL